MPQSRRALHASLLKVALRQRYFLKNFTTTAEQRYWKMHQDGCFDDNFIFEIFLNDCFSKTAAKIYLFLKFSVKHVLHFLLWRHVKEERIFMKNFLSEGFSEKCKHTISFKFQSKTIFLLKNPFFLQYTQIATPWTSQNLFLNFSFFKDTLRP